MYHLQSDLEISASEIEDNASTSSQLGHLSKEQIYSAFQKAQMRYHKYRGRYTDLAKHYKDLERENSKMKSVLVETQDKAIRRVTELKEQCSLEQKAKAHLEGALRDEIDEKQLKIESLQTKIELLQNGANSNQDGESLETLNKYLTDARQEIESLNAKIQEMKANVIIFQTKEQEYKLKISGLEKEVTLFAEREKENNLTLAQNKMELHHELLSKDNEITNLKKDNETLKKNLDVLVTGGGKLENLQSQNKKLIEKLENLTSKCNGYENELLKMEQHKIEAQNSNQLNADLKNQLKEMEEKLEAVREDAKKSLISLEEKVREKLRTEFEKKEEELRTDLDKKLEEISSGEEKDFELALWEKDEEIQRLKNVNGELLESLTSKTRQYDDLEKNHLELIDDSVRIRSNVSNLEKDLITSKNDNHVCQLKIGRLESDVANLEKNVQDYETNESRLLKEKDVIANELQTVRDLMKDGLTKSDEVDLLKSTLQSLEEEKEKLVQVVEDERQKRDEQCRKNAELLENIQHLKDAIQKREENLDKKKKGLERKLEDEKIKLQEKLEASENTVRRLEETSTQLGEELKELNEKKEEVVALGAELEKSTREKNELSLKVVFLGEELSKSEESNSLLRKALEEEKERVTRSLADSEVEVKRVEGHNSELIFRVEDLEKKLVDVTASLENERQVNSVLRSEESRRGDLEETNAELRRLVEEKDAKMEEAVGQLEGEVATFKDTLRRQEEEVGGLREELLKNSTEMKKRDEERNQTLEELNLLKKLLEEANNNLTVKEHEMRNLERKYVESEETLERVSQNLEARLSKEEDLLIKQDKCEKDLKLKETLISALSKKLDEYNDFIDQRNEGFSKIFTNFPGETPNHFVHNKDHKNLQNLEEKLQIFEKTFSMEKENLTKILTYLKKFEEKYSSAEFERAQLEHEKGRLSGEVEQLRSTIQELTSTRSDTKLTEEEFVRLKEENATLVEERKKVEQSLLELESRNAQVVSDSNFLSEENNALVTELEELKIKNEETRKRAENDSRQNAELERHVGELQHEKQLLQEEIEELKTAPINLHDNVEAKNKEEEYAKEIENLRTKVVQYKSLDLTNRSSIEFYENELQKLKNQNEKLNRKLDETLVTLNHCSELSNSTEIEYLKNVLYNYMLGKESLVLARVIAAVCKFDPHQTELILAKEQQKQTLVSREVR